MSDFDNQGSKLTPNGLRPGLDASKWVWFVPSFALCLAILPLPYTYYMGLRWLIAVAAAFVAWKEYELGGKRANSYVVIFGVISLLYNPILPIHLFKLLWVVLNLLTAAAFMGHYRLRQKGS